jgi:hypothetical protein
MKRSLFVGNDWADEHDDVELQDEAGRPLGKAKLADGLAVARDDRRILRRAGGP